MYGWFRTTCPICTSEKVWCESRLSWLVKRLGAERMKEAIVIEPTDEFFPEPYREHQEDVQRIFKYVCEWMQIDRDRVVCEVHDEIKEEGADDPLGLYVAGRPARILVRRSQISDPESLVATIAHELAHELLLGGGHLTDNNEDLERLTDLTTLFCGLGIFGANSALRETTVREGNTSFWSIQKQGYLPLRMYGYGMSLFCWARGERHPAWAEHLRLDARAPMLAGLKYLWKTGDSTFRSERPNDDACSSDEIPSVSMLVDRSASVRLLALVQFAETKNLPPDGFPLVAALLTRVWHLRC